MMRLAALILAFSPVWLLAQAGVAPKVLFDAGAPSDQLQILSNNPQVSTTLAKDGIEVQMKSGPANYPGITLKPTGAAPWNLGLYGRVEAKVTNTGSNRIALNLRVDNAGQGEPWNDESKVIDPGQTKTIRVYFGHSYGFRPSFKLNPEAVTQLLFFTGKLTSDVAFRVERIQGAGWVGEKIGVDPDRVAKKPASGIILDQTTAITPPQIGATAGAKASASVGGLQITFAGGKDEAVTLRPAEGLWNLNEHLQVTLQLKNTGTTPITPSARVESESGPTDLVTAIAPIQPGAEAQLVIPFAAKLPWKLVADAEQANAPGKGSFKNQPGTGTEYRSNVTTGVAILSDGTPGEKSLLVTSITAGQPELKLPDWLGKRPPVEGDWTQTLSEEFDGDGIDLHRWNVRASNYWDKRMHFSKDQIFVKDGLLKLRLEKKPGHNNDDPAGALTDYAAGQPDTYGKWTQRYGYIEIREKQPTAKCCWPGLWMMPDRGAKFGKGRGATENGGMEFDITESQSSWGIHRFNIACHWDGYGKDHKAVGTSSNYVQADKDGYIVVGLLWTPGAYVVYGNGQEIFRFESPRVSNHPAHLILQNEIGGWDNEEVDDAQLPADFTIDYIRAWQRKDLASEDDGPKPNQGTFDVRSENQP